MKKIILALLLNHFQSIIDTWSEYILKHYSNKISEEEVNSFCENSLNIFIDVIDSGNYTPADQYLIDIYNMFKEAELNLLEISQFFSQGRITIINYIESDDSYSYDPMILMGFLDEIIEQIYARYGMLHQSAKMKELESDRDRLAAKLRLNQQYLKNILHTTDSAIMIIDSEEKFIAWNKGAEEIFGYTEEEVIGKPSTLLLPKGKKYKTELERIKAESRKSGFLKLEETERITKEGTLISVILNVASLPSDNGSYAGRSVIIKDYTEVKQLRQQVDQSEKLAVIGKLAAGVAHEIGNPLAAISSIVQILQRKTAEDFTKERLATIKENIDRITKIVRELVDFSRPPSHEHEIVQITDVIKTALGIVRYDKRVKKVNFIQELQPNLPMINLVPDQLLQVFVNIMLNGLDAINGEGTIKVKSHMDTKYVYVEISDDGCGMDNNTLEQIFDPFFTTKEVGKGTGLGLSVSYGIIKKFRGDIIVKSKIDEGSTFIVKLPYNIS